MIQRKQTLWLFFSACIIALVFFVPYGIQNTTPIGSTLIVETSLSAKNNIILAGISIAIALGSLASIMLFRNRSLQQKMCLLLILLCVGCGIYIFYDANLIVKGNKLVVGLLGSHLYLGLLMPLLSAFFIALAFIGIRADEKLIKSSDRLR